MKLFYHSYSSDFNEDRPFQGNLLENEFLKKAVTLHYLKLPLLMYRVHRHYNVVKHLKAAEVCVFIIIVLTILLLYSIIVLVVNTLLKIYDSFSYILFLNCFKIVSFYTISTEMQSYFKNAPFY